ncbi:hypothetical protein PF005_g29038 [Phytophthora fragariae]|uniref:Uncharacterized protein n=1 Tax=Phytophthora fragariae TaxID=53985 RepID=A0A6A3VSZ6_9STRA|nr:hypothetical protein PF005_g29038 [Phytophthora fragariae]
MPKKRPKTETKGVKRGPGHRKKVAVEPACDSDDEKREVELKVVELSDDVKGRFGQDLAVKVLETKFLVFFFATNNFASVSFKMIDPLKLEEMTEEEDEPVAQAVMQSTRRLLLFFLDKGDLQLKPTTQEAAKKAKGGDSQSIDKFRRWLWDVYVSFILEMLQ